MSAVSINELPDDLLLCVFNILDLRAQAAAELTCRRWRSLMRHVSQPPVDLWVLRIQAAHWQYPEPPYRFGDLYHRECDTYKVNFENQLQFLRKHNKGKELFLHVEHEQDLQVCLGAIAIHWHQLKNLQIDCRYFYIEDSSNFMRYGLAPLMTRIRASSNPWKRNTVLNQLLTCCTNLEAMCLENEEDVTLKELPTKLESLFVPHASFQSLDALIAANPAQMKAFSIRITDADQLTRICITFTHLVTLRINVAPQTESIQHLALLKKLRNLSIHIWNPLLREELEPLLATWSDLKTLELGMEGVTSTVVQAIPTSNPHLEAIGFVDNFPARLSIALKWLPELGQMKTLKSLSVLGLSEITPVVELIRNSSIHNVDVRLFSSQTAHTLVQTMNTKALENKNVRFRLRVWDAFEHLHLSKVSKNLTLYFS